MNKREFKQCVRELSKDIGMVFSLVQENPLLQALSSRYNPKIGFIQDTYTNLPGLSSRALWDSLFDYDVWASSIVFELVGELCRNPNNRKLEALYRLVCWTKCEALLARQYVLAAQGKK